MTREEDVFSKSLYERSFVQIQRLTGRLPEESFTSLAREVLVRVAKHAASENLSPVAPQASEIEKLAEILISNDPEAGSKFIMGLREEGVTLEDVYLGYLAEAARKLGDWWKEDKVSLLDVTIGTGRIYAILRALSYAFPVSPSEVTKTAVFAAAPDETHTLGVRMATDLFRRDGWDIALKINKSHQELVDEISKSNPVIIGLSGGGIHSATPLAKLVVALRISNPKALIMISGNIVAEAADLVSLMGVDAMPLDYEEARVEMDRLWRQVASQK